MEVGANNIAAEGRLLFPRISAPADENEKWKQRMKIVVFKSCLHAILERCFPRSSTSSLLSLLADDILLIVFVQFNKQS